MRSVAEHLLAFCDRRGPKDMYSDPKRFREHVYASNRICMLRIHMLDDDPQLASLQPIKEQQLQKWALLIDSARERAADYLRIPQLPPPIPCIFCSGTGKVGLCPYCDDGLFENSGHDYECASCHGTGQRKQIDGDQVCNLCHGSGETNNQLVLIGCGMFNRRYLALIADFPEIRIARPINNSSPVYFQSTIGDGVIAQCTF